MSHITLEEYIAELPQSLTRDEKIARANEWKQTHSPKSETVEEVKTKDSTEKDPNEESKNNTGSVASDSGNGKPTFTSMFDEDAMAKNNLDIINQRAERFKKQQEVGSKIFSNYLKTGIDPFSNESFNDVYKRVAGKDLNEIYNQFEYDKSTELEEVLLTTEKNPFNYNAVGEALGGAGLYADSGNIYEQLLQQELLSNFASKNNATTVNNLIDSGAISSLDETSKLKLKNSFL